MNEHRNLHLSDNERLEFLGDAVLELLVSRFLFQTYPNVTEGKLTKLRQRLLGRILCHNLLKSANLTKPFA